MKLMIKYFIQPNYFWMSLIQVITPVAIVHALIGDYSSTWWLVTLLFYFLYLCIGNNVGMHRFFSHRYFVMRRPVEWMVAWCAMMPGLGSPISYASIHNVHHRCNDTKLDPHGRVRGWRSMIFWFHKHLTACEVVFSHNLIRLGKQYKFVHHYYWPFVFANALVMYLISWELFLFAWLIPAGLTLWAVALVLLLQHDNIGASNTKNYKWFGWGETWHANHHANPNWDDHADSGGIDWTYQITRILKK